MPRNSRGRKWNRLTVAVATLVAAIVIRVEGIDSLIGSQSGHSFRLHVHGIHSIHVHSIHIHITVEAHIAKVCIHTVHANIAEICIHHHWLLLLLVSTTCHTKGIHGGIRIVHAKLVDIPNLVAIAGVEVHQPWLLLLPLKVATSLRRQPLSRRRILKERGSGVGIRMHIHISIRVIITRRFRPFRGTGRRRCDNRRLATGSGLDGTRNVVRIHRLFFSTRRSRGFSLIIRTATFHGLEESGTFQRQFPVGPQFVAPVQQPLLVRPPPEGIVPGIIHGNPTVSMNASKGQYFVKIGRPLGFVLVLMRGRLDGRLALVLEPPLESHLGQLVKVFGFEVAACFALARHPFAEGRITLPANGDYIYILYIYIYILLVLGSDRGWVSKLKIKCKTISKTNTTTNFIQWTHCRHAQILP